MSIHDKSAKSNIRKDMISEYGEQFIENYSLFRQGELCFLNIFNGKSGLVYVYEGQFFNFNGETILPIEDKNGIQIFFAHFPSAYWKYNISQHVDGIFGTLLEGKDWTIGNEVYRYRDGKFYQVVRGYVFSSWMIEEELSKNKVMVRILKDICSFGCSGSSEKEVPVGEVKAEPKETKEAEGPEVEEQDGEITMENSTIILKKKDFPPLPPPILRKRK